MTGSFEAYWVDRRTTRHHGSAIEFEGTFSATYVTQFVTEARAEGYQVELIDGEFVRVTFEPGIWREFYPVGGVVA